MMFGFILGLCAYGLFAAARSTFRIEEGHVGVVTRFGAALTEGSKGALRLFRPGFHWKAPWDHVVVVSIKEQAIDLSGEKEGQLAMADDGTILRLDSVLRFVPDEAHLGHFLFGMRAPIPHIKALFTCILRSKIANFRTAAEDGASPASRALDFSVDESMGSYALIRCERHKLNDRIAQYCREVIGSRYGVRFHAVDVTDILPPDELRDALNAVIGAQAEAGTAYYRAESESRRRLVAAQEGVAIAKVRASAVETEILELGSFLRDLAEKGQLDSYVRRRRAEVMSEARTLYVKEPS